MMEAIATLSLKISGRKVFSFLLMAYSFLSPCFFGVRTVLLGPIADLSECIYRAFIE